MEALLQAASEDTREDLIWQAIVCIRYRLDRPLAPRLRWLAPRELFSWMAF